MPELEYKWVDKYAPSSMDDLVLDEAIKTQLAALMKSKNQFSLLFAGPPGIGKTTIIRLITKSIDSEVLWIEGGLEGGVNTIQNKIKPFCDSMSIDGRQKIVVIDEIDSTSSNQDSSFQKSLRNIMNEAKDTMFLASCNYVEKVLAPIQSRMTPVNLKYSAKDLLLRLKHILDNEKITYSKADLKTFVEAVIKQFYPDIRQIVSWLQTSCSTGKLTVNKHAISVEGSNEFISELVSKIKEDSNILNVRRFYTANKNKIHDFVVTASELYNYVLDNGMLDDKDGILAMNDAIYELNLVIDKDTGFFKAVTVLSKYLKENNDKQN